MTNVINFPQHKSNNVPAYNCTGNIIKDDFFWLWLAVILRANPKNASVTWLFGMAVFYQCFVWDNQEVNASRVIFKAII